MAVLTGVFFCGLAICVLGLLCCFVMMVRNEVVYQARMAALDEASYETYRSMGSYDKMLWDFTCWTKAQFITKARHTTKAM